MTQASCFRQWTASKNGYTEGRSKWWPTRDTPRARPSKRWPNERWIFSGACREKTRPRGGPLPTDCPRALSFFSPRRIGMFARRAICCGPRGNIMASRSGDWWLIVTRPKSSDCQPCLRKPECCPGNQSHGRGLVRQVENAAVRAFREKMASAEAQRQYRRRGRVVEFCHAWIKSKLGLRQFHVRGLVKVQTELLWGMPHLQLATVDSSRQVASVSCCKLKEVSNPTA